MLRLPVNGEMKWAMFAVSARTYLHAIHGVDFLHCPGPPPTTHTPQPQHMSKKYCHLRVGNIIPG